LNDEWMEVMDVGDDEMVMGDDVRRQMKGG
jgi:hypothetical protein